MCVRLESGGEKKAVRVEAQVGVGLGEAGSRGRGVGVGGGAGKASLSVPEQGEGARMPTVVRRVPQLWRARP